MKIILSNSNNDAYKVAMEQLKKDYHNGSKQIIIAPDRYVVSLEATTMNDLEKNEGYVAAMNVEHMSFERLGERLLGNEVGKCLTKEGAVMLLANVIEENKSKLQYYKRSIKKDGFASQIYDVITQLRNSGASTEDVETMIDKLAPALKLKVKDIALIYGEYLKTIHEKHSDPNTILEALIDYLNTHPLNANVYCVLFQNFTALQIETIKALNNSALSLTISMVSGKNNPNSRIYGDRYVQKIIDAVGDKVDIVKNNIDLNPIADAISKYAFAYNYPDKKVDVKGKLKIKNAKTMEDEVLECILDIVYKVRHGKRYKDFEVYVGDIDAYYRIIKDVCSRYDVPFFIDKKERLKDQAKIRFLISAMDVIVNDFSYGDVMDFVKNPIFTMDSEMRSKVYRFENYCLKYNIDRYKFKAEFTLGEEEIDYINEAEEIRKLLFNTLTPLNINKPCKMDELVGNVKQFLVNIFAENNVYNNKLESLSAYYGKCNKQVDTKIENIFDEMTRVSHDEKTIDEFSNIFKSMVEEMQIALIPTQLDGVFFGTNVSSFQQEGDKYIIGANNGRLPRVAQNGAILSYQEETALEKSGIELYQNCKEKIFQEMLAVVEFMKTALNKNTLTISYSETGSDGDLSPSSLIDELKGMFVDNGVMLEEKPINFDDLQKYRLANGDEKTALLFATKSACYHNSLSHIKSTNTHLEDMNIYGAAAVQLDPLEKSFVDSNQNIPEYLNEKHEGKLPESTSVSKLEKFFACPYAYYFKYVLRLKDRQDGEFEGYEMGTIIHYILEHFLTDYRDGLVKKELIPTYSRKYFNEAIKENEYEYIMERPEKARLLNRIVDESCDLLENIYEIAEKSEFKPYVLEGELGQGGIDHIYLDVDGQKVRIDGKIDRVDRCGDNFLIIDYKTYKSAALNLKEIYSGKKLQLHVYMRAVENGLKLKSAGVFYLPIFVGFLDDETPRLKYSGQVLGDVDLLEKIDTQFEINGQKSIVPYSVDKKGNIKTTDSSYVTRDQLDSIGDYVIDLATEGAKLIGQGYIMPTPAKNQCDVCEFNTLCAYRGLLQREEKSVNKSSFGGEESEETCDEE